jgi:hypothetical protein
LGNAALTWLDYAAAGTMLSLIIIETVADQQQWNFQQEKLKKNPPVGFITTGLYRFSRFDMLFLFCFVFHICLHFRHPNFFSEISIWFTFYLFGVSASGWRWINWTLTGPVLLMLLFQVSVLVMMMTVSANRISGLNQLYRMDFLKQVPPIQDLPKDHFQADSVVAWKTHCQRNNTREKEEVNSYLLTKG